jgi:two-component system sensor histidine kinase RegB
LTVHIKDDGPGIPLEILEGLGEPFLTMRSGGMGLGLFLANASIQRLGGTIKMENMREGGAMTTIILPLVP